MPDEMAMLPPDRSTRALRGIPVRLLLGLLLLLSLFTLALVWQRRVEVVEAREPAAALGSAALARPYSTDWVRLIVGAPSGTEVLAPAPPSSVREVPAPSRPIPDPHATAPAPREFELIVRKGQSLSEICKAHYKTARPALVAALARYNEIADPASVREGQKVKLPPLETLERAND